MRVQKLKIIVYQCSSVIIFPIFQQFFQHEYKSKIHYQFSELEKQKCMSQLKKLLLVIQYALCSDHQ